MRTHGLLIAMTNLSDNFCAPNRMVEDVNGGLKSDDVVMSAPSWRALFLSFAIHFLGVASVMLAGQWHVNNKEHVKQPLPPPPVEATLYIPRKPVLETPPENTPTLLNRDTPASTQSKPPTLTPEQRAAEEKNALYVSAPPVNQTAATTITPPAEEEVQPLPVKPNQSADRLTLSPKAALSSYFDGHNQQQIKGLAQQDASTYRKEKQSPALIDTRKGVLQPLITPRPVKKVNCTSTTNKVITFLSGIAGGTLTCTKLDNHNRFIDARVQKNQKGIRHLTGENK